MTSRLNYCRSWYFVHGSEEDALFAAPSSARNIGALLASEDLAADLGSERGRDSLKLAYARQRFFVECVAAGTIAVDCPHTWQDLEGLEVDAHWARRMGYKAKSIVAPSHAVLVNETFSPSQREIKEAQEIVRLFDDARAKGQSRAEIGGSLVEVPTYLSAKRLLERARGFEEHLGRIADRKAEGHNV